MCLLLQLQGSLGGNSQILPPWQMSHQRSRKRIVPEQKHDRTTRRLENVPCRGREQGFFNVAVMHKGAVINKFVQL